MARVLKAGQPGRAGAVGEGGGRAGRAAGAALVIVGEPRGHPLGGCTPLCGSTPRGGTARGRRHRRRHRLAVVLAPEGRAESRG
eukprot:scaffold96579_cov48-Phaeocystis_antarctica.AAC.1